MNCTTADAGGLSVRLAAVKSFGSSKRAGLFASFFLVSCHGGAAAAPPRPRWSSGTESASAAPATAAASNDGAGPDHEDGGSAAPGHPGFRGLLPEPILKVIQRHTGALQVCYGLQANNDPTLKGSVTLSWTIDASGVVTRGPGEVDAR